MSNQPGQAEHKVLSAVPPAAPAAPSAPAASASSAPPNNRVQNHRRPDRPRGPGRRRAHVVPQPLFRGNGKRLCGRPRASRVGAHFRRRHQGLHRRQSDGERGRRDRRTRPVRPARENRADRRADRQRRAASAASGRADRASAGASQWRPGAGGASRCAAAARKTGCGPLWPAVHEPDESRVESGTRRGQCCPLERRGRPGRPPRQRFGRQGADRCGASCARRRQGASGCIARAIEGRGTAAAIQPHPGPCRRPHRQAQCGNGHARAAWPAIDGHRARQRLGHRQLQGNPIGRPAPRPERARDHRRHAGQETGGHRGQLRASFGRAIRAAAGR